MILGVIENDLANLCSDGGFVLIGIDDANATGFGSGASEIAFADRFKERQIFLLNPIKLATLRHAAHAGFDRDVEQQGEAGLHADELLVQYVELAHVETARVTLIREACIGETITHHPGTVFERGQN